MLEHFSVLWKRVLSGIGISGRKSSAFHSIPGLVIFLNGCVEHGDGKIRSLQRSIGGYLCAALLAFSAPSGAQDLFLAGAVPGPADILEIDVNAHIRGYPMIPVAQKMVPVMAFVRGSGGYVNIPLGTQISLAGQDASMIALVVFTANLSEDAMAPGWNDKPCTRSNFLWKKTDAWTNQCSTIDHLTGFMSRPTGDYTVVAEKAGGLGIKFPATILQINFSRFDNRGGKNLWYKISINPERYGFESENVTSWRESAWHKDRVNDDPRRREFMSKIVAWGEMINARMGLAFEKKMNAFGDVPALDEYLSSFLNVAMPVTSVAPVSK